MQDHIAVQKIKLRYFMTNLANLILNFQDF